MSDRQLEATMCSILMKDGAVGMLQTIEKSNSQDVRIVSTKWVDENGTVLREDQTVLVDKMPPVSAESKI